jgi:hypothetical protein
MTADEWIELSERIGALWPPAMTAKAVDAYWRVLEGLEAVQISKAVALIARMPRQFRPDAGLIYETAMAQASGLPALPAAVTDPLSAAEHQRVLAELKRYTNAEHERRGDAVMALLRATGHRIPLVELRWLMHTRECLPEQFDERMAKITAAVEGAA